MKTSNRDSKSIRKPHLGTVLVLLLIVTFLFTGVSFSQYATTAQKTDQSRVAAFGISQAGSFYGDVEMQVVPGMEPQSYEIVLTNKSEVDLEYTMAVEQLANNIPLQISIQDAEGQVVTGHFAANSQESATYTVNVQWDALDNDAAYSYEVDAIRVTVTAVQVDTVEVETNNAQQ